MVLSRNSNIYLAMSVIYYLVVHYFISISPAQTGSNGHGMWTKGNSRSRVNSMSTRKPAWMKGQLATARQKKVESEDCSKKGITRLCFITLPSNYIITTLRAFLLILLVHSRYAKYSRTPTISTEKTVKNNFFA